MSRFARNEVPMRATTVTLIEGRAFDHATAAITIATTIEIAEGATLRSTCSVLRAALTRASMLAVAIKSRSPQRALLSPVNALDQLDQKADGLQASARS